MNRGDEQNEGRYKMSAKGKAFWKYWMSIGGGEAISIDEAIELFDPIWKNRSRRSAFSGSGRPRLGRKRKK